MSTRDNSLPILHASALILFWVPHTKLHFCAANRDKGKELGSGEGEFQDVQLLEEFAVEDDGLDWVLTLKLDPDRQMILAIKSKISAFVTECVGCFPCPAIAPLWIAAFRELAAEMENRPMPTKLCMADRQSVGIIKIKVGSFVKKHVGTGCPEISLRWATALSELADQICFSSNCRECDRPH